MDMQGIENKIVQLIKSNVKMERSTNKGKLNGNVRNMKGERTIKQHGEGNTSIYFA